MEFLKRHVIASTVDYFEAVLLATSLLLKVIGISLRLCLCFETGSFLALLAVAVSPFRHVAAVTFERAGHGHCSFKNF
jgi:hypothetical protein